MLSTREGWQEAKLGVVVREEHHVVGGPQTRGATTEARYVVWNSATELGPCLLAAAEAAGLETAKQVVVVSDGALWLRGLAEQYIPQATQVLDWPHVIQHLTDFGKAALGEHDP
ncbi:MAG: transposase [Deltaproteobacteria bacterium]|nr:transposase [Deltaproteobacteria bacterium]